VNTLDVAETSIPQRGRMQYLAVKKLAEQLLCKEMPFEYDQRYILNLQRKVFHEASQVVEPVATRFGISHASSL